ncbi:MAG TPA: fibronectin type III domain-containing protein [Gaiellaceae bacterium]
MRRARRCSPLAGLPVAAVLGVAASTAFFAATGSGNAAASVGTLSAPTPSATAGAGTVALSWSAVSPPGGSGTVSYYVQRDGANAGGNCATQPSPSTSTSCTDSGLSAGTYHYTVTALWRSWSATSTSTAVTLASGALHHFSLAAATTTPTAGAGDNLTITAKDSVGNTVTAYGGDQTLTFSGASAVGAYQPTVTSKTGTAVAFGTAETIAFTTGVASVSGSSNGVMTLYKAETATVSVSDGTHTGSLAVTVGAAAAGSITATSGAGQSATVSTAFTNPLTATVTDGYGNAKSGASVTFSAPPSGASASFASGGNCTGNPQTYQCVATTNAGGVATSSAFTANAAQGSYDISATAGGGSNPSITYSETNIGLLHISSLATGSTSGGTTWTGSATVTVTSSSGAAVNGVAVTGSWSPTGAASPSGCTTNSSGQCTISPAAGSFPNAQLTETWTVSSLSLSGYSYASAANAESAVTLSRGCAATTVCATNLTSTTTFTDTTTGTSSSTASLAGTNTPPSGSTVLILIARDGSQSGDTVSSVTGSVISNATLVTSLTSNLSSTAGAFTNLWVYRAQGTGATTGPAVTVSFGQSDNRATLVQVLVLSGENTKTPIAQSNNTNKCTTGCTTTATVSLQGGLSTGSKEIVLTGEAKSTTTSMSSASWATKLFWANLSGTPGCNYGSFFGTSTASGTVTLGTASVWGAIALEVAKST